MSKTKYFRSEYWLRFMGAIGAGASLVGAFEPFHIFWLAPVALVALLALWHRLTPGWGFLLGWGFGIGSFGAGISWVYNSIHNFGNASITLAFLLTAALVLGLALFPALVGWALCRFFPAPGLARHYLAFPALWIIVEWLRTWLLTGFPWLLTGYSQLGTWLDGYAPIFGVLGVSLILVITSASLWHLLMMRTPNAGLGVLLVLLVWALGLPLQGIAWTHAIGAPLSVALVQGNVPQDEKWVPENYRAVMQMYLDLTRPYWGSSLIAWPEASVPIPYAAGAENYFDLLEQNARRFHSDMILGIVRYDPARELYFNSVLSIAANGRQFYDKYHLVPYGEYFPVPAFVRDLLRRMHMPYSDMTPGVLNTQPLRLDRQRVNVFICYEAIFGREVMARVPSSTLMVNVSNDAWFGDSLAPHQHLQMVQMRALEAGRELLRATNTGITAIIDHHGRVVDRIPQFERAVLSGTVQPRQGITPYVRWLDWPVLIMVGLLLLGAAWGVKE
jgi:apolipoprotein N-acyltransferase